MRISTSRIVAAGVAGAVIGLLISLALGASGPVPLLLALAGCSIAVTLAQAPPAATHEPQLRLAGLEPPDAHGAAWLPDPLGSECDRYWDGETWTRHVWRRTR